MCALGGRLRAVPQKHIQLMDAVQAYGDTFSAELIVVCEAVCNHYFTISIMYNMFNLHHSL